MIDHRSTQAFSSVHVPVFGLKISKLDLEGAIRDCRTRAERGDGGSVCFVNVHTATESVSNEGLRGAMEGATHLFADGVPLVWASKLKRSPVGSRVCGPDFMTEFLSRYGGDAHGFIGGQEGVAQKLVARFKLAKAHCYSPPFRPFSSENAREDWAKFVELCGGAGSVPRYVWIGLGAPKQEQWMEAVRQLSPKTLFFGVGAAFDFLGGTVNRAPEWMQATGIEWVYRLGQEPRRLWKRYLMTNSRFVWLLAKDLLNGS